MTHRTAGWATCCVLGFALLGTPASAAPRILYTTVSQVGRLSATITTETDSLSSATLELGPTPAYGESLVDSTRARIHRFRIETLDPARRYHARVRISGATGDTTGEDLAWSTVVTELPAAKPAPRLELGLFGVDDTTAARGARGTAFERVQCDLATAPDARAARLLLDVAAAAGTKILAGLGEPAAHSSDLARLRDRVRALRAHPALSAWCVEGSPGVAAGALEKEYQMLHQTDPAHPVVLHGSPLDGRLDPRGACDRWICGFGLLPGAGLASIIPTMDQARATGVPWELALDAYPPDSVPGRSAGGAPGPTPTRDQLRSMAYLALEHGASGVWALSYDRLHGTYGREAKWVELTELARELRGLDALWTAATAGPVVPGGQPDLDVGTRVLEGRRYVVAVNFTAHTVNAHLAVGSKVVSAARIDADGPFDPGPSLAKGRVGDVWRPYAVHVYALAE